MAELLRPLQIGHCANQQAFNSSTDQGDGKRRLSMVGSGGLHDARHALHLDDAKSQIKVYMDV